MSVRSNLPAYEQPGRAVAAAPAAGAAFDASLLADAADETSVEARVRQLERCNLELRRSNEELSQFAYVAAHDLQEPLRKVAAFCQLLQDEYNDRLDDNARGYIKHAVDGAGRMKALVANLLNYSRVQTPGEPPEPADASAACDEAIENLSLAIEDAKAEVTRAPLPVIHADPGQLVRLFQNLIANAIKYRGKSPSRVEITAEESADEWLFRVRDNGIGIDPRFHAGIFHNFQRLHAREEYAGVGIGLAVCKRIVEQVGGRIWVESSVGSGSVFCFKVPKSQGAAREGAVKNNRPSRQLTSSAY